MLVTREQSDGLLGQNVLDRRSGVPSEISIKKRRIVDDADRILDRTEMESVNQPPMVIGASKLVHRGKESIHNSERAGVSLLPTNATQIVPSKTLAAESLGPMEKQSATSPSKLDKALSPELSASRKKRKADMQTKGSASGSGVKPNVTSQGPVGSNGTLSAGKSPTKRTHRRFQSEEPDVIKSPSLERDGQAGIGESTTEPDEISNTEDEEPETVSASIGLDQSRIPVADAAKAIERQKAISRTKRKAHDKLLKKQARSATKRKSHVTTLAQDVGLEGLESHQPPNANREQGVMSELSTKLSNKKPLPAFLPDEILAAEPTTEPPPTQLEALTRRTSGPRKRKFIDTDSKSPHDIKREGTTFRVLASDQTALPAKASKASKMLKESWLAGRRGIKGGEFVKRFRVNAGFVRK
ncbi:hypothetical protein MMC20_000056 [Loxospora ochrophaea]|nr:hypothetical protein [Loxospora ochrophaea]